MQVAHTAAQKRKRALGWIGVICWILIIPVKEARRFHLGISPTALEIGPSLLGPAGLLFVILSSERRLARLTLSQVTVMTAAIALALEFAQRLPRPGPLARVRYTFDWSDVLATLASVSMGALIAALLRRPQRQSS